MISETKQKLPPGDNKIEMPVKNSKCLLALLDRSNILHEENVEIGALVLPLETGFLEASDSDAWSDSRGFGQSDMDIQDLQTRSLVPVQTLANIWQTTKIQSSLRSDGGKVKVKFGDGLEEDQMEDSDAETDTDGGLIGELTVEEGRTDTEALLADEDTTAASISALDNGDAQLKPADEEMNEYSEEGAQERLEDDPTKVNNDSDSHLDITFDEKHHEIATIYALPQTIGNSSSETCTLNPLKRKALHNNCPLQITLSEIQTKKYSLLHDCSGLNRNSHKAYRQLVDLQEQEQKLQEAIRKSKEDLVRLKAMEEDNKDEFNSFVAQSGISQALFQAYEEFCESLHPQFGQRGGFSITCHADHGGSYVLYDKYFALFRENVEEPYKTCNFRCEASVSEEGEAIVEFWPIESPEPKSGKETTWGEQYVSPLPPNLKCY